MQLQPTLTFQLPHVRPNRVFKFFYSHLKVLALKSHSHSLNWLATNSI